MNQQAYGNTDKITAAEYCAPVSTRKSTLQISSRQPKSPWWHSQFNLMLCVFALLAIATVTFIRVAPSPDLLSVTTQRPALSSTSTAATIENQQVLGAVKQQTEARSEAQNSLSELLQNKKELEDKRVDLWAADRYQVMQDLAQQGDDYYKQQQYDKAIASYQLALKQINSLQAHYPSVISARLEQAENAIAQGKSELAKQTYTDLLQLDDQNPQALAGLKRANNLDQALRHLKSAREHEQTYANSGQLQDIQAGVQQYQQALSVDDKLQQAQNGLQRAQQAVNDKQFRSAMSQGFKALFVANYTAAKKAFSSAVKLKPEQKIASSSYQQALAASSSSSLSRLLSEAANFEAREDWRNALSNYQLVLQRDANQVSAKLGQLRSGVRQQLDTEISNLLSEQIALSHKDKQLQAKKTLADAKAISKKGPKLKSQIEQLDLALQQTQTPIEVRLVSDSTTTISLLKVGANKIQLGQFIRKSLSLKPGKYIATGMRKGFVDVRHELIVNPGNNDLQTLVIKCSEPI